MFQKLRQDFSLSALIAGMITILVGYASSAVIIFQAANVAKLPPEITASWIMSASLGIGVCGVLLSWRFKIPIIIAWSTPAAALLATMLAGVPIGQAVTAYLVSALIMIIIGLSGTFDRLMRSIPPGISAALFAGILFHFGTQVFTSISLSPAMTLLMIGMYFLGRKLLPRYAIALVLLAGILYCLFTGTAQLGALPWTPTKLVFITPEWSFATVLGLALPLALVTLTGQYIPGMTVLQASGYEAPASAIFKTTGVASAIVAFFGGHSVNLAAISAAICTGSEAHPDKSKRYVAGVVCGVAYIAVGIFGSTIIALFSALPHTFITVLAGLALISSISSGIIGMVKDEANREASMITFLVTASDMVFLGLGSAFWGLVAGISVYMLKLR